MSQTPKTRNSFNLMGSLTACFFMAFSSLAIAQTAPPPGLPAAVTAVDHSQECDRDCLLQHMDRYLAAVLQHDPSSLEVNPSLRVGENSYAVALGDNAWQTILKIHPYRLVLTDPFAGQVLMITTVEMRSAEPFIYVVRLKIENNRISESESMLTSERNAGQHFRSDLLEESSKLLDQNLPPAQRMSRSELLQAARINWGLESGTALPLADSCLHYENWEAGLNGTIPCNRGLGRQMTRNLRIPLVDTEKGVVVNFQLQDEDNPVVRPPPPGEVEGKTPVFYYRQLTFNVMQMTRIANNEVTTEQLFMNLQDLGVRTVFRQ